MLNFFKKNKDTAGSSSDAKNVAEASAAAFKSDQRKANRFFEHAQTMAEARNHDYAIECYINGLRHDPDNMTQHEALRDVALRRKVAGGKPVGMLDALKGAGKAPIDKFVHQLTLWAKSPLDVDLALKFMEACQNLEAVAPQLHMGEVANWAANTFLEAGQVEKKPSKNQYLKARDLLRSMNAYDSAILACKMALSFDPTDAIILQALKDLEAEQTMSKAGYEDSVKQEGGFKAVVKDFDKQRELDAADQISSRTESALDQLIVKRQAEYEESPQDTARLARLVDTLLQKNTDETDAKAVTLLQTALEQTGQYKYKLRIGDIRMRQFNRHLRDLRTKLENDAENGDLRKTYQETAKQKLQFELEEYADRVKNYPTDMSQRFELGKRLVLVKRYDDAIASLQEAKSDAKYRVLSLYHLAACYQAKGWLEEAINTAQQAQSIHPVPDDRLAMDIQYLHMDILEQAARTNRSLTQAKEAEQLASTIVQNNINYRDIRDRRVKLQKLSAELAQ